LRAELEARLLSSIASADQFSRLRDVGINRESFATYPKAYDYLSRMLELHGKVPRLHDLKELFDFPPTVTRTVQEFEYLIEEAERASSAQAIQEVLDKRITEYGDQPTELIDALVRDLSGLRRIQSGSVSITDGSIVQRFLRYEEMSANPARGGIATGMSFFDDLCGLGWLPGEFNGVVGRTYIGKSWLLLYFGITAWTAGKSIVFISPEMSIDETEARFDGLLLARHDIPVDVTQLYRGYVPNKTMMTLAHVVSERRNWWTYSCGPEGAFGLSDLHRLVDKHKPDMLIVDGLPLLAGQSNKQVWESIKEISYGLKGLAIRHNITVLVSHQANRGAHNTSRAPKLHEIAYGDAFAQACDRLLALSRPTNQEGMLRISVQKFRKGKEHQEGFLFVFKPEKGIIHEYFPGDFGAGIGSASAEADQDGTGNAVSLA